MKHIAGFSDFRNLKRPGVSFELWVQLQWEVSLMWCFWLGKCLHYSEVAVNLGIKSIQEPFPPWCLDSTACNPRHVAAGSHPAGQLSLLPSGMGHWPREFSLGSSSPLSSVWRWKLQHHVGWRVPTVHSLVSYQQEDYWYKRMVIEKVGHDLVPSMQGFPMVFLFCEPPNKYQTNTCGWILKHMSKLSRRCFLRINSWPTSSLGSCNSKAYDTALVLQWLEDFLEPVDTYTT